MRTRMGFTLIELLIVVAIIAILAAIATPNFLEAQVRAKISRVKADMRTEATGIESYAVDWNRPPLGATALKTFGCVSVPFAGTYGLRSLIAQTKLTTPIAYLTSLPEDPFATHLKNSGGDAVLLDRKNFIYQTYYCTFSKSYYIDAHNNGHEWSLLSYGPGSRNIGNVSKFLANWAQSGRMYDSTNGSVSRGWLIRTSKGECGDKYDGTDG